MSEPESEAEKETITTYELLERSAESALDLQREDGSFPPGKNGPYQDAATPVRNTSNWLKILSFVYNQTNKERFRRASNAAINYLQQDELRPHGYTYECRKSDSKDSCNGIVGQANVIEAMARAGTYLDRPELYDYAAQIYHLHPFNKHLGVWNRVEIDGRILTIDRTFNHQLIFAAAGSLVATENNQDEIKCDIYKFIDNLSNNMGYDKSGIITHRLRPKLEMKDIKPIFLDRSMEMFMNPILHSKRKFVSDEKMHAKELGYQSVNLYWLANLKKRVPEHDFWSYFPIETLLDATRTNRYRSLAKKRAGWFSNMPPGFEISHAINTFEEHPDNRQIISWIKTSIQNHYNEENDLFVDNCDDAETMSGLIYKLIDCPNMEFSV